MLGEEKRAVSSYGCQCDFYEVVVGSPGEQQGRQRHRRAASNSSGYRCDQYLASSKRRDVLPQNKRYTNGECHGGCSVVEQALRFDQKAQTSLFLRFLERRDHRHRVGGRDEHAE